MKYLTIHWVLLWLMTLSKLLVLSICQLRSLEIIHSWTTVDFVFPPHQTREAMIASGSFIPANNAIVDVDVWQDENGVEKIFVSLPKFSAGIPYTLATVETDGLLKPYPDWSWHQERSCDLTSVFRMQIDRCNRLWVLDSGIRNILDPNPNHVCRPQIFQFDLNSDSLLGRYRFPDGVVDPKSRLVNIELDTRGEYCDDTVAYIADDSSFRLIVYHVNSGRSWRISNNYFFPHPFYGRFEVEGVQFDLMDGIVGLALGPLINGDRTLYWHSLASVVESWVNTSIISNESLFLNGINSSPQSFEVSFDERESQSAAEVMSSNGVLIFGLIGSNSIACWNSKLPYSPENMPILEMDDENLQFPSGIKIRNGILYVLTNRFQNQVVGEVSEDEVNYRILVGNLDEITASTSCATNEQAHLRFQESSYERRWL